MKDLKKITLLLVAFALCFGNNVCAQESKTAGKFTIVLDAGHGGKDPGCIGKKGGKEKNINLAVTKAVGKLLEQNQKDMKVVYTRQTDVFVELNERAAIANRVKADLFVSIHTNALPGGKVNYGAETYTLGMHRAAENLAVATRENSVITLEKDYESHRAISYLSSCRTRTWRRACIWRVSFRSSSVQPAVRTKAFIRPDSSCFAPPRCLRASWSWVISRVKRLISVPIPESTR